ncbi:MAG TPA: protein translocase subunit SecD [Terriglobales bacterium]|jgi:preprotein translocase subunit SecD|nr:protein translocase subunit SecD [Terriglobales bacterium]
MMQRNLLGKTAFIIAVLLIFVYGIFGIPQKWNGEGLKQALLDRIHLGLDLKGGTHLILQVMVNDAVNADSDVTTERLKESLNKNNVAYGEIYKPDPANHPEQIAIKGIPASAIANLRNNVLASYPQYDISTGADNSYLLTLKSTRVSEIKQQAVTQAIETIRQRVDALGVSEPLIEEHGLGNYQIVVQLPGVDPDRAITIIQSTAMLEVRGAIDQRVYPSEQEALQAHPGGLPPNAVLVHGSSIGARDTAPKDLVYVLNRSSVITGRDIRDAETSTKDTGAPIVNFYLTNDGGERFKAFTGAHVGDYMAIVLDNRVVEFATIKSEIGDSGLIEGGFTAETAKDLTIKLRSGALPAGIQILQKEIVGPSLGADSIRQGVTAAVIGMSVVMLFMLIYYRFSGINADLALILNLVILLGFLGFSGATLTLPGIAGVILTIGMGVDSNVLIFERIREELRNGKTPAAAVDQGFGKAWLTIIDTHVTTIVSAFILIIFGTGPVRGFAITLCFGLLANIFTAVFVSRVIFDAGLQRKERGEALSI